LVNKFLKACGGLPLSLKVIGALLNGKDTSYWEDQLNRLERILPNEIKQKLQISYDALECDEKQIFLDIACFFIGEDRDMAVRIWDNGLCGFRNIQDRCLVEVNSEKQIKMHDHLRDMGREIAKASGLPRRLWRWTEDDIDDLLQQSLVTPVRGIRMALSEYNEIDDAFGGITMRRMQLLDTESVLVKNILTKVEFPNLTWLRWKTCPHSSMPSWISMKNLRVLQVEGKKLKTLWKKESQAPSQLRELSINAPLKKIPKSIEQLKHLERIEICHINHGDIDGFDYMEFNFVALTKLPEEFCLLLSLKTLVLQKCSEMKSLPECFGNLTNLHHIDLGGCSALERLPDSFCRLIKLEYLQLEGCTNLTMSSETLGNISTLEYINLSGCDKFEVLPPQVARQRSLEQLCLGHPHLKVLPSEIGELQNLKKLELWNCKQLECLPASLGLLTQLTQWIVYDCPLISELPLKTEVKGERETLSDFDSSIHNYILPRLQRLRVVGTGISELSFAQGVCFNLRHLRISCCDNVVEVGTLPNTLAFLQIWNCNGLRKIDKIYGLAELGTLDIRDCRKLEELPGIETLVSLSLLSISGCVMLKSIRGLGQLTKLQTLTVRGCSELEEVEGIQQHCMSLVSLNATGCPKLRWSAGVVEQLHQRSGLELIGV
jgi:Leucine-rich repeat (LRR) protein